MVTPGTRFIKGTYKKAVVLGAVSVWWARYFFDAEIAWAVLSGLLVMGLNLLILWWTARRLLHVEEGMERGSSSFATLFLLKLLVLLGLTYYVVIVAGLNALGFVTGYIVFMVAMTWEGLLMGMEESRLEEQENTPESDKSNPGDSLE